MQAYICTVPECKWFAREEIYQEAAKGKRLPPDEFVRKADKLWEEAIDVVQGILLNDIINVLSQGRCRLLWLEGFPLDLLLVELYGDEPRTHTELLVDEVGNEYLEQVDNEGDEELEDLLYDARFTEDMLTAIQLLYGDDRMYAEVCLGEHDRHNKRGDLLIRLFVDARLGDMPIFDKEDALSWYLNVGDIPLGESKEGTLSLFG